MGRLEWIIGGIVIAGIGILGWQMARPPSGSVTAMAPQDTTSPNDGVQLADVRVPEDLSPGALIGRRAFEAKCAPCHGTNAAGQNGVAPPLVHQIYRPGHHDDEAFLRAAMNGVQAHHWSFGDMPPVEGLTRADVAAIAIYVRELQRENGIN